MWVTALNAGILAQLFEMLLVVKIFLTVHVHVMIWRY